MFDLTRQSSFEHVDSWIKSVRLVSDVCVSVVVTVCVTMCKCGWVIDGISLSQTF